MKRSVLSDSEVSVVVALQITTAVLSLLGSGFVVASMVYSRSLKTLSSRLVFNLSISSVVYAATYLLTIFTLDDKEEGLCYFQGLTNNFAALAVFFWTAVISFNLYSVMIKMRIPGAHDEKLYHAGVWGAAVVLSILPTFTGSYGRKGLKSYWCWIDLDGTGGAMRLISFYVPLYVSIAFVGVMYGVVAWRIRKNVDNYAYFAGTDPQLRAGAMALARQQLGFPLAFLLVWIFPTINRIHNWASSDELLWLYVLQALTEPLLGFVNALVYGFSSYRALFSRLGWLQGDITLATPAGPGGSHGVEEYNDLDFGDDERSATHGINLDASSDEEIDFTLPNSLDD